MTSGLSGLRFGRQEPSNHQHSWKISPTILAPAGATEEEIQIPDPAIFRGISIPPSRTPGALVASDIGKVDLLYPSTNHLAMHLCLIECFYKLRNDVMHSKDLDAVIGPTAPRFASAENTQSSKSHPTAADAEMARTSQIRKWELFIKAAVGRFDLWWQNIDKVLRHAKAYNTVPAAAQQGRSTLSKNYLPPLDVLLVWYSYILHPSYFSDSVEFGKQNAFMLCFPWHALYEVIDQRTLNYNLPTAAANMFKTMSSQSVDLISCLASPPPYTASMGAQYSIHLEDAVAMQESFVNDTHELLWLRSPACPGSLTRCLERYKRFLLLVQLHPDRRASLVPTWDIELALRTHQLYADNFQTFTSRPFGRDLDYAEVARPLETEKSTANNTSETNTADLWKRQFAQPYTCCLCWACECVKDASSGSEGEVSTSNLSQKRIKEIQKALQFCVSVERARESGDRLPAPPRQAKKTDDKWELDWGHGWREVVVKGKFDEHGNPVKKVVREKGYTWHINWMMGAT
ncbi:hypothetical protein BDV38DRAFT_246224 [Aspergillus pseudotamarii]|uniref:Uncharacterized protein n=1 Tax=Aspergillus pseudotamarii TaxID=132259 RepID=A0A5N6ST42_ASPPS|nr:uncharacterized protein BDV38DRAFT_246224 [Aspergillus pseudotamarii]KAE8137792.1 hypothetical protein BDV38DRAFT_246224 [Aspergillus pseudotamarii]